MGNDLACRLPSINLLSLDLPLPRPQYYPVYYDQQLPHLVPRQPQLLLLQLLAQPFPHPHIPTQSVSPSATPAQPRAEPDRPLSIPSIVSPAPSTAPAAPSGLASLAVAAGESLAIPPGGPFSGSAASSALSLPTSSRLSVSLEAPHSKLSALSAPTSPKSPELHKDWKPRKKRQCPECHLYFSNLATHKSTHLKPTSRPHVCKLCQRGFARPNDLFRHFKCHWKEIGADNGQFRCPFKNGPHGDHCCHTLGIFSRCDTYKNHLKAIHFQYPGGTKKSQRNLVPGSCRLCQAQFRNVDEWIVTHIDAHQCPYGQK